MQISFECVSFEVFCKHANLDLECILRDSCLYLFFVIIGKSSIQISVFCPFQCVLESVKVKRHFRIFVGNFPQFD